MLDHIAIQLDREGIKGREDGERGGRIIISRETIIFEIFPSKGGNYSGEAINQGTAILPENMVALPQDFSCSGYFKCNLWLQLDKLKLGSV